MDLLAGLSRKQRRWAVGGAVRLLNLVLTTKDVREAEAARRELLPERGPEVHNVDRPCLYCAGR